MSGLLGAPGSAEKTFGKHSTQKPVALVERCLAASTNEGDLVLDPFLGNGTTAVAAMHLNRQCVTSLGRRAAGKQAAESSKQSLIRSALLIN